jgi:hydroxymethylpyrimidine/phosphomethylpyrimidine kinase
MSAPIALTIAGSDCSGGAGIQADLKTFCAFGVYGASVVTALTAQNTVGVHEVQRVEPPFVSRQLIAVLDDLDVAAIKTGMLADAGIIEAVVDVLESRLPLRLVVDPVMVASSGDRLLAADAVQVLRARLMPLATLVTPNLAEAEALTGRSVRTLAEMHDVATALLDLGARAVLVKGGHLVGAPNAVDVLHDGDGIHEYAAPRLSSSSTHGTGCTLSAAITAELARGSDVRGAVAAAKRFVTRAIETAAPVGRGTGPLNHLIAPPPALPGGEGEGG